MARFSLISEQDEATCKQRMREALQSWGCEIKEDVGPVMRAEGKMKQASFWWTSPLMRGFGRLAITLSFSNPSKPEVKISLNTAGHVFQVISIGVFGALTIYWGLYGIGFILFLFYPWFTDLGIKKSIKDLQSVLQEACKKS